MRKGLLNVKAAAINQHKTGRGRKAVYAVLLLIMILIIALSMFLFAQVFSYSLTADTMLLSAPAGPDKIRLSWTEDTQTSMTITWQDSPDTAAAWIEYAAGEDIPPGVGPDDAPGGLVMRADAKQVEHQSLLSDGGTQWTVTLDYLEPGTYAYRIYGGKEAGIAEDSSAVCHFSVPDNTGDEAVSFAYFGDVQVVSDAEGEYTRWGKMAQDAYFRNPDIAFGIMAGDIVESGISTEQFDLFFDAASSVFSSIPLFSAIGNHESNFMSGKPELYLDSFVFPENGPEGFSEEFYSFDYGKAHILVLNSWVYSGEQKLNDGDYEAIREWIRTDLNNVPEDSWKIVVMHHPVYAVHSDRVSALVQENWAPLLEEGGVDLLLCGHQHVYCRSLPMTGGLADYENGITQVMGVSGEKFYSSADEYNMERTVYGESTYQIIRISGGSLELQCFNRAGDELDYAVLSRDGGQDVPDDRPGAERFTDVKKQDWFYDAVDQVSRKGYFNGTGETVFSPGLPMTRAMFVTVLGRVDGADETRYTGSVFSDVAAGKWFSAYVKWASDKAIVNGVGGGLFAPDGDVTREQMAAILYRYAGYRGLDRQADDTRYRRFSDQAQVSPYAREAVIWATDRGIINGTGVGLEPRINATRAQVAQIIMNYLEKAG